MAVRTFVPEHGRKRIHGVSEMWKCPVCERGFVRQGQPHFCGRPETVDEYIAAQDEAARPMLIQLRTVLRLAVPDAQEIYESCSAKAKGLYNELKALGVRETELVYSLLSGNTIVIVTTA